MSICFSLILQHELIKLVIILLIHIYLKTDQLEYKLWFTAWISMKLQHSSSTSTCSNSIFIKGLLNFVVVTNTEHIISRSFQDTDLDIFPGSYVMTWSYISVFFKVVLGSHSKNLNYITPSCWMYVDTRLKFHAHK